MNTLVLIAIVLFGVHSDAQQNNIWSCNSQNGVKSNEVIAVESGMVQDGPGGIRSNTWCEWTISAAPKNTGKARRVKLVFKTFQMMTGEDFIWIFDDAISTTVPVERLTGTNRPEPLFSATEKGFRLEFRSSEFGGPNAVAEEPGFLAEFKTIDVAGVCNPSPCSDLSVCIEDELGSHRCTRCPIGFTGNPMRKGGCVKVVPCTQKPMLRRDLRMLSVKDREAFFSALQSLRSSGVYDEIMWIHADKINFNFAHLTDAFLPWHREYLRMMEAALQSVSPETNCMMIPFWDWTLDAADPARSPIFTDAFFGGTGVDTGNGKKCVQTGRFAWKVLGNDCLQRDLNGAGFFATREEILNTIASNDNFREFSRAIELFHDTVHRFIGGTMVLDNSADEPLFFVHHSFIDMLWSMWEDCHDYDIIPSSSIRGNTNVYMGGVERGSLGQPINTDYNAPMPYRLSHFNPQVAPRDMMDNAKFEIAYDNAHIMTKPATIEWFDPRWTTCTIENTELFKTNPQKFTEDNTGKAAAGQKKFQALVEEESISFLNHTRAQMGNVLVANGKSCIGPEVICNLPHMNFTDKCMSVKRWSRFELDFVAKTLPSCQKQSLQACLAGKV